MGRLGVIIRAIWNKILGRTEDKYYNDILDLSYEQMQARVVEVGQGLAAVAQSKHRILQLVKANREEAVKYETAAVKFLEAGDESNARASLEQKAYIDQHMGALQTDLDEVNARQTDLEATKKDLDRMVGQFLHQKETLKARHTAAKASSEIAETITGISSKAMDAGQTIGRMRERTNQLEARAAGIKELMSSGTLENALTGQTALDGNVAAIERKSAVDGDLARLKRQLEPAKS